MGGSHPSKVRSGIGMPNKWQEAVATRLVVARPGLLQFETALRFSRVRGGIR